MKNIATQQNAYSGNGDRYRRVEHRKLQTLRYLRRLSVLAELRRGVSRNGKDASSRRRSASPSRFHRVEWSGKLDVWSAALKYIDDRVVWL